MTKKLATALAVALMTVTPAIAQEKTQAPEENKTSIQNLRPSDKTGINVFEAPKSDKVAPFKGLKIEFGAGFAQNFQMLKHENASTGPNTTLMKIGTGFNNAAANLSLNAQIADGIRVNLTQYLSSRHHQETWVKGGEIVIDKLPLDNDFLTAIMSISRLRVGHMEINYGDAHFRRTDNGNAMYNPFVGNLLMDAFTTEVGAEGYLYLNNLMFMGGVTGGEIKGNILTPEKRSPAFLGKITYDKNSSSNRRARLSLSMYTNSKSAGNTLYSGDRAGSPYMYILENSAATATSPAWSGNINPGFSYKVTAYQMNPFIKLGGLELFGVLENAKGRSITESNERTWNQAGIDLVYRFMSDRMYVGARQNMAKGQLVTLDNVSVNRQQFALGMFLNNYLLIKGEYINQRYNDYPKANILSGGKFKGFMMQGVIGF